MHPLNLKGGAFVLKLGSFAKDNRNLRIAVVLFYPKSEPIAIVPVFTVDSVIYICGN